MSLVVAVRCGVWTLCCRLLVQPFNCALQLVLQLLNPHVEPLLFQVHVGDFSRVLLVVFLELSSECLNKVGVPGLDFLDLLDLLGGRD